MDHRGTIKGGCLFFLRGPLSQWHKASMTDADGITYNCCEQYMMYKKAMLFGDAETAAEILNAKNSRDQKALGRKVRGFDSEVWDKHKNQIVFVGNLLKFSQNPELRELLRETGKLEIVEANGEDRIWGIGMYEDDPEILNRSKWGENCLGKAIMRVRDKLFAEEV